MTEDLWPSWTTVLPEHWERKRLKHVCVRYADYGLNEPATSYVSDGIRFLRTSDIDDAGHLHPDGVYLPEELAAGMELCDGDILLSRSGTIGRSFRYSFKKHGRCSFAGYLIRYRPDARLHPDFAYYFTKSAPFASWISDSVIAATIGNVNGQKFANTPIGLPSLVEQSAIVAFLDRETAHIDALIDRKRRLLERLEEKRLAVITHAVTKGLDPKAPMKDSGIDWLGQIPAHWQVKRQKYISPKITVGIVVTPAAYYTETGIVALRGFNIKERHVDRNDLAYISDYANELHLKSKIYTGDLVAVRTGQPGTTAVVPDDLDGANCVDLIIIRRSDDTIPEYAAYFANSDPAKMQYGSGSEGALQQHFNIDTAKNLVVPLPPRSEQEAILGHLQREEGKLLRAMATLQSSVDTMLEYRSALITNAVTGKIDVRGHAQKEVAA